MRYNITYRAARRKAARKEFQEARREHGRGMSHVEFWHRFGQRYVPDVNANGNPVEQRRLGITAKQAKTETYTSNGAREVARRMRRINKEK